MRWLKDSAWLVTVLLTLCAVLVAIPKPATASDTKDWSDGSLHVVGSPAVSSDVAIDFNETSNDQKTARAELTDRSVGHPERSILAIADHPSWAKSRVGVSWHSERRGWRA